MGQMTITGGAGFIGSNLAKMAHQKGWGVTILDNLSTGLQTTVNELADLGIKVIIGDIRDRDVLNHCLANSTVVVHLAAQVSVSASVKDPQQTIDININGTQNVIQACLENDVHNLIVASSSAVYGEATSLPLNEEDAGELLSPYASSKWTNEQQIFDARQRGLQAIALRLFNVYGTGQRSDGAYAAVIPKFVDLMARGIAPNIDGDGLQTRDFIHVSDVCCAIMALVDGQCKSEQYYVYNVATQTKITLLDLVAEINNSLTQIMSDFRPLVPTHGPERIGDVRHSMANIERISTNLGWSPSKNFKQGIHELILERTKMM